MKTRTILYYLSTLLITIITLAQPARALDPLMSVYHETRKQCTDLQLPQDRAEAGLTEALCAMRVEQVELLSRSSAVSFPAFIADESWHQTAGYQRVADWIIKDSAMLFVFSRETFSSFHMCNVEAPLWIAWFRADGILVDATRMEPTCSARYAPSGPDGNHAFQYALEMGEALYEALIVDMTDLRLRVKAPGL